MRTVRLTVTKSACRSGYCKQGDSFVVKDLCPPLCHEFWNSIYPSVYALLNGALLDYGEQRATQLMQNARMAAEYVSMESSWKKIGQNRNEFLPA